ncbi:hypothetical protein NFI95_12880 [Acetobacteraceae bacterium KSS8]|uniref:Uncharacterized protein n=1 Tax=Endosaccharibacter trunci TaxID=2812733 RepID=A0ABT1W8W8_9PROT|nr:hypothetical protein [Acetobacteraceae bacterium KSS8]
MAHETDSSCCDTVGGIKPRSPVQDRPVHAFVLPTVGSMRFEKRKSGGPSFSEEKEAKRLLSVWFGVRGAERVKRTEILWSFPSKKNACFS